MADTREWNAYDFMGRTQFNRDLLGLVALAKQLRDAIEAFVGHDVESVTEDMTALGMGPDAERGAPEPKGGLG